MKSKILPFLIASAAISHAATISWNFDGNSLTPTVVGAGFTASPAVVDPSLNIDRNGNPSASSASSNSYFVPLFNQPLTTDVNTVPNTNAEFMEFSIAGAGTYTITSISFAGARVGSSGRIYLNARTSVDSFASSVSQLSTTSNSFTTVTDNTLPVSYTGLTGTTSLRIYFSNNSSSTNTSDGTRLDNVVIEVIPEPSTALLGAIGMLALLRRRRA